MDKPAAGERSRELGWLEDRKFLRIPVFLPLGILHTMHHKYSREALRELYHPQTQQALFEYHQTPFIDFTVHNLVTVHIRLTPSVKLSALFVHCSVLFLGVQQYLAVLHRFKVHCTAQPRLTVHSLVLFTNPLLHFSNVTTHFNTLLHPSSKSLHCFSHYITQKSL